MSWGDLSLVLSPVEQKHTQVLAMVCDEENQMMWLLGNVRRGWKANLLASRKKYLYEEILLCEDK